MGGETDLVLSSNLDSSTHALECAGDASAEIALVSHLLNDIPRNGRCRHPRRGRAFQDNAHGYHVDDSVE